MTMPAHPEPTAAAAPRDARTLLERAIAEAPSHMPPPVGWLRRLFARDRSAAALIRRYRLQPAIEHAYERVVREMGPVRVAISAEDDLDRPYVLMECITASAREPSLDFQSAVRTGADALLRPEDRIRLSVFVRASTSTSRASRRSPTRSSAGS